MTQPWIAFADQKPTEPGQYWLGRYDLGFAGPYGLDTALGLQHKYTHYQIADTPAAPPPPPGAALTSGSSWSWETSYNQLTPKVVVASGVELWLIQDDCDPQGLMLRSPSVGCCRVPLADIDALRVASDRVERLFYLSEPDGNQLKVSICPPVSGLICLSCWNEDDNRIVFGLDPDKARQLGERLIYFSRVLQLGIEQP